MVQFAVDDDDEKKFWRIFQRMAQQTMQDIEDYYRLAYSSPELGEVIYDNQLMPIYRVLEKKLFLQAYAGVLDGEITLGSIEGYLKILYAIFGRTAQIEISKENPCHIKIDIIAPLQVFNLWISKDKKSIITRDNKAIVFSKILAQVTNRDLLQILKATTKAGVFVEFTLNRELV